MGRARKFASLLSFSWDGRVPFPEAILPIILLFILSSPVPTLKDASAAGRLDSSALKDASAAGRLLKSGSDSSAQTQIRVLNSALHNA